MFAGSRGCVLDVRLGGLGSGIGDGASCSLTQTIRKASFRDTSVLVIQQPVTPPEGDSRVTSDSSHEVSMRGEQRQPIRRRRLDSLRSTRAVGVGGGNRASGSRFPLNFKTAD